VEWRLFDVGLFHGTLLRQEPVLGHEIGLAVRGGEKKTSKRGLEREPRFARLGRRAEYEFARTEGRAVRHLSERSCR
jgi:hypothetical protein